MQPPETQLTTSIILTAATLRRRQFKSFNAYDLRWNYDYIYSWQMGEEINGAW